MLGRLPDGSTYGDAGRHAEAETVPGLLIVRLDAPLFLANVQVLRDRVRALVSAAKPPIEVVLLDLEATSELDLEGIDALGALGDELDRRGAELWLARVHAPVREMLERADATRRISEVRIYPSVRDGANAYLEETANRG